MMMGICCTKRVTPKDGVSAEEDYTASVNFLPPIGKLVTSEDSSSVSSTTDSSASQSVDVLKGSTDITLPPNNLEGFGSEAGLGYSGPSDQKEIIRVPSGETWNALVGDTATVNPFILSDAYSKRSSPRFTGESLHKPEANSRPTSWRFIHSGDKQNTHNYPPMSSDGVTSRMSSGYQVLKQPSFIHEIRDLPQILGINKDLLKKPRKPADRKQRKLKKKKRKRKKRQEATHASRIKIGRAHSRRKTKHGVPDNQVGPAQIIHWVESQRSTAKVNQLAPKQESIASDPCSTPLALSEDLQTPIPLISPLPTSKSNLQTPKTTKQRKSTVDVDLENSDTLVSATSQELSESASKTVKQLNRRASKSQALLKISRTEAGKSNSLMVNPDSLLSPLNDAGRMTSKPADESPASDLSVREQNFGNLIDAIVTKENHRYKHFQKILEIKKALKDSKVSVSEEEIELIFGGLLEISQVHSQLVYELSSLSVPEEGDRILIGISQIYLKQMSKLRLLYVPVLFNLEKRIDLIKTLRSKDKECSDILSNFRPPLHQRLHKMTGILPQMKQDIHLLTKQPEISSKAELCLRTLLAELRDLSVYLRITLSQFDAVTNDIHNVPIPLTLSGNKLESQIHCEETSNYLRTKTHLTIITFTCGLEIVERISQVIQPYQPVQPYSHVEFIHFSNINSILSTWHDRFAVTCQAYTEGPELRELLFKCDKHQNLERFLKISELLLQSERMHTAPSSQPNSTKLKQRGSNLNKRHRPVNRK